jgi:hypothetical protein
MSAEKMRMKKRVLCVDDGEQWKYECVVSTNSGQLPGLMSRLSSELRLFMPLHTKIKAFRNLKSWMESIRFGFAPRSEIPQTNPRIWSFSLTQKVNTRLGLPNIEIKPPKTEIEHVFEAIKL